MYDSVEVLYKLPMPEDPKGFTGSEGYQTKSFDNLLSLYEIDEKGELYVQKSEGEWVNGDPKAKSLMSRLGYMKTTRTWRERVFFNGAADIYDYQNGKGDYDYWIQYKLSFNNGILCEASILQLEATPNEKRKKSDEEFRKKLQACADFRKSIKYRYFFKYTNYCVRAIFNALRKIVIFASNNLHKAEEFLTV